MPEIVAHCHPFDCPQCKLACEAKKLLSDEGTQVINGVVYVGSARIVVDHPVPHCSMFLNMDTAQYLRDVMAAQTVSP